MEQWEAENWRKKIELTVIKPVLAAVQSVTPDIQGVDFDLQNGAVIIDSPTVLIDDQWKRVQEIGEEKIRSIVGCTSPIRIRQLRRSTFAYTFHGPSDAIRKRIRKFEEITEYNLELAAINSLAEAYSELIKRSKDYDVVVGFALGGVPALNFVTVSEFEASKSGLDNSQQLNDMQEKYHVFPGLLWEMDTESPRQILTFWMDSLAGRKSALFFDTGTDGNGVRETADILQAYVQNCEHSPFSRITVLGVVDGDCEAQHSVHLELHDRSGAPVPLDVSYHRVRNVFTEDCKALAGYESLRRAGMIQPYSTSVVLHIRDQGQTIKTVTARSSGALMNYLIKGKLEVLRQGKMEDPEFHDEISGAYLLSVECEQESSELRKAVELGLLSKAIYGPALRFLRSKYGAKYENEQSMRKKGKLRKKC
jgi:hypothetical protein